MVNLDLIQKEVASWSTHCFGDVPPGYLMLGLIEEIGEFCDWSYTSRVYECDRIVQMEDALGDQAIYVMNLCEKVGLEFSLIQASQRPITERELLVGLGRGAHGILKNFQSIRGITYERRRELVQEALRIWYSWAVNLIDLLALRKFEGIIQTTWDEVKRRDWAKNPLNAHQELT